MNKSENEIPPSASEGELLEYCLSYFTRRVFGYDVAPHHQRIIDHICSNPITLDLCARGAGKSRIGNIAYATWVVCNTPDARVLILSDTDTHSVRFLSTIKSVLERSPVIKEYYGNMRGSQWSDHQITTSLRKDPAITEASISALGTLSGGVTSGHYTHILGDDLDNFTNTRTPGMRDRARNYWKTTVLPTLLPGGEIHNYGTRYHYDDIYNMFITELGYDTQIQPGILDIGTPKERSIWEAFMPLHTRVIDGRTVKGLVEIRDGEPGGTDSGIGSLIFALQYMNDTTLQETGSIFHWDWFNFYDKAPLKLKIYQGIDLAISKKSSADFFVIVTIGIDPLGNVYVLDIYRERGVSFNSQVQLVLKKAEEWKPLKIGIESNAYQASLMQEVQRLSLLPVLPISTSTDKTLRAQMRSGLVESGRVFVKSCMHDFVSELVLFDGVSGFDDQFDAFDFALTVAEEPNEDRVRNEYFVPEFNAGY